METTIWLPEGGVLPAGRRRAEGPGNGGATMAAAPGPRPLSGWAGVHVRARLEGQPAGMKFLEVLSRRWNAAYDAAFGAWVLYKGDRTEERLDLYCRRTRRVMRLQAVMDSLFQQLGANKSDGHRPPLQAEGRAA